MIKDIISDEAILSIDCETATADDAEIAQDLLDTLLANEGAAALAANQIGETKRIIAFYTMDDKPHVFFNPVLKQALRPTKLAEECLSREGSTTVRRFGWIKIEYQELVNGTLVAKKREYTGWEAEVVQHMIDHCNGKLI